MFLLGMVYVTTFVYIYLVGVRECLFHGTWSPALEEAENFFAVVTLVLLEECRVLKMNDFALFVKNYKYGVAEA